MVEAAKDAQTALMGEPSPYKPSWIDRLTGWVERLPGPSYLYYLLLAVLLLLVGSVLYWTEGILPIGEFYALHVFLSLIVGYLPALLHYLDDRADAALCRMQPLLQVSEVEVDDLRYRLTTLPAWPTFFVGLIAFVLPLATDEIRRAVGQPGTFDWLGPGTSSYWFTYVLYRLLWWPFGVFLYHTWHQLRQIHCIYTEHTRVNLFRRGPLFAFPNVTALTAVGLLIPPYGFVALIRDAWNDAVTIAYMLPVTGLALAAFVWPLLGVHRLLSEARARLLDENSLHLEAAIVLLRQRAESGELEQLESLNTALQTLESERHLLGSIPTWPWQTETVRLLFTALGLPLGLWFAQVILQRLLSP